MVNELFFSIVIPTFNRADLIGNTIESVLCQVYQNFEVLVIDDGGSDNTSEVVNAYSDHRVRYFYKANEERAAARNYGAERALGQYITFLDSDDRLYPNCLTNAVELIQPRGYPEFIHLAYEIKSDNGKVLQRNNSRTGSLNSSLLEGNVLSCIGVFLRTDVCREYKFNSDRMLTGSEDYELWLRLASRYKIHYSNTISGCILNHTQRSVLEFQESKLVARRSLLLKYFSEDPHSKEIFKAYNQVVEANMNLYISLHAFMAKRFSAGVKFYLEAIKILPKAVFTRKSLGILKNALVNIF